MDKPVVDVRSSNLAPSRKGTSSISAGLVDRLVANVRSKGKDLAQGMIRRPVREYLDRDLYAHEVQKLFRELPIVVAHTSQLPNPGDFITHDKLGVPIIVTRTKSGAVAAFRNICAHRAATVETQACGHRSSFICPYHNWTYDLDGSLLHIPDAASFADEDLRGMGLRPVAVAEKCGLVFVRITDGPAIDIDAFLGEMATELTPMRVGEHRFFSERWTPLACNWKVMLEGSLETYHIGYLHAAKLGRQFLPMACTFDSYAPHQRHVMPKRQLVELVEKGEDPRRAILPTYCIFPNTMLTMPHDHMTLTQVFPTGVDKCVFYNSLLTLDAPDNDDAKEYWGKALALTEGVNDEDFAVLEGIQRSHEASPDERLIHGRYELGITRFNEAREQLLAERWHGPWGKYLPNA